MKFKKTIRLIAKLDIKGPNLVKGSQLEGLRVLGDPEFYVKSYYKQGIDEIFYNDCVASLYGKNALTSFLKKTVNNIFIPITVGGGIRTLNDIDNVLKAGADRVSINSAAIKDINFLKKATRIYGSSTISVLIESFKIEDNYYVFYENGKSNSNLDVFEWAKKVEEYGAGEIILTNVNNEGLGLGIDYYLSNKINQSVSIPVILHGGIGSKEQILDCLKIMPVDGFALASILHYDCIRNVANFKKKKEGNIEFLKTKKMINKNIKPCSIKKIKKYLHINKIKCKI